MFPEAKLLLQMFISIGVFQDVITSTVGISQHGGGGGGHATLPQAQPGKFKRSGGTYLHPRPASARVVISFIRGTNLDQGAVDGFH